VNNFNEVKTQKNIYNQFLVEVYSSKIFLSYVLLTFLFKLVSRIESKSVLINYIIRLPYLLGSCLYSTSSDLY
jgi:hypothetical protein